MPTQPFRIQSPTPVSDLQRAMEMAQMSPIAPFVMKCLFLVGRTGDCAPRKIAPHYPLLGKHSLLRLVRPTKRYQLVRILMMVLSFNGHAAPEVHCRAWRDELGTSLNTERSAVGSQTNGVLHTIESVLVRQIPKIQLRSNQRPQQVIDHYRPERPLEHTLWICPRRPPHG